MVRNRPLMLIFFSAYLVLCEAIFVSCDETIDFSEYLFVREECDLSMRTSLTAIQVGLLCAHEVMQSNRLSKADRNASETFKSNYKEIADLQSNGFRMDELEKIVCDMSRRSHEKLSNLIRLGNEMEGIIQCSASKLAPLLYKQVCQEKSKVMIDSMNIARESSDFIHTKCDVVVLNGSLVKRVEEACNSLGMMQRFVGYLICRIERGGINGRLQYRLNLSRRPRRPVTGSSYSVISSSVSLTGFFILQRAINCL